MDNSIDHAYGYVYTNYVANNNNNKKNMKTKILNLIENTVDDYYPLALEGQYCRETGGSSSSVPAAVAEFTPYIADAIDEDESDVAVTLRELIEGEVLSFDFVEWLNPENEQHTVSVLRLFVTGNNGEYLD